jgi:O-antigen/teichoic acid export membrane protein
MKRLSKNLLAIVLSDVTRRVLGFLAVAYLARKVGTAGFGAVNIGLTVLSYAMIVSTAGLSSFGTRAVARGDSRDIVPATLSLRGVNALAAWFVVLMIAFFFVQNRTSATLIAMFSISLFAHAFLLDWYFQGKEEMAIIGLGRIVSAATYLLMLVVFVRSASDILWVAAGTVAGDFLNAGLLVGAYRRRQGPLRMHADRARWKSMMKQAFPLGSGSILAHLSVNLPTLVIGIVMTNTDVGIYNAANKLVFFLLVFDRVFATLLLPASARLYANSSEDFMATLTTALKWIIMIALPLSLGGTFLSNGMLEFVFGNQYLQAAPVFRILIWYFFFTMIHTVFATGLIAAGQENVYGKVMVISAVLFGVSIILLTEFFGIVGTAIAVVGSEAVTLVLMRRQFLRFVRLPLPASLFRTAVAAAVMGLALVLLPPAHVLVSILVGGCTYVLAMFALRTVTVDEVSELLRRV